MSLPAGAYSGWEVSYMDAGNEISSCRGFAVLLTAGNFAAQSTLFTDFVTAMDAIVLGDRTRNQYATDNIQVATQPTNGAAREIKLLVQMQNSTSGRRFTFTVPTLDPALPEYVQNINARDVIEVASPTEIADFVTATNAFVRDPFNVAQACAVIGLKVVGRNL